MTLVLIISIVVFYTSLAWGLQEMQSKLLPTIVIASFVIMIWAALS